MASDDFTAEDLTLDGNAAAGLLQEAFGVELTTALSRCAHCGNQAPAGTLRAYMRGPGTILRCSVCSQVVVRVCRTPKGVYLDMRGAVFVRLAPSEVQGPA